MDRSTFPQRSDGMPEHQAHNEQPPGVDQPHPTNPWTQFFSGDPPPPGSQPQPEAGFIRRPAGWAPAQAGRGAYTPFGSSNPLSAAISRAMAADAAAHGQVDAPPPGSAHQLHMNLVGARLQPPSTSLPLWEVKHRHAPLWAMPLRSRIRQCDSGHSGQPLPMLSRRNGRRHHRCHRPTSRTCTRKCQHRHRPQGHLGCLCSPPSVWLLHRCLHRTRPGWNHHQRWDQDLPPAYAHPSCRRCGRLPAMAGWRWTISGPRVSPTWRQSLSPSVRCCLLLNLPQATSVNNIDMRDQLARQ